MWIRIQDELILVESKLVFINKNIRNSKECAIVTYITGNATEESMITLGEYKDFNEAKKIFEDIERSISSGDNIYIMP